MAADQGHQRTNNLRWKVKVTKISKINCYNLWYDRDSKNGGRVGHEKSIISEIENLPKKDEFI